MKAAIDIGSNSLLLVVVDGDGRVLHDEARVVGMSKGLGDSGVMQPDRREHARRVLLEYTAIAERLGVPAAAVRACATSGARRATDAPALFAEVRSACGLRVETLSGLEEARWSYVGATSGMSGPRVLVDLGGGSTEFARGDERGIAASVSLEMGAVRLTEAFDLAGPERDLERSRAHVDRLLQGVEPAPDVPVVLVAGTATTLAAIRQGLTVYDGARVHGSTLTRRDLREIGTRLQAATPAERLEIARVSPKRADYLLAGTTILERALARLGTDSASVSDRGLRFGLLER